MRSLENRDQRHRKHNVLKNGRWMEILQAVLQVYGILFFVGHFVGLLACELLIKQAFLDLGKPDVPGARRREVFMRVFNDKTYCRALAAHNDIILAIAIARFLRRNFFVFIASVLLVTGVQSLFT